MLVFFTNMELKPTIVGEEHKVERLSNRYLNQNIFGMRKILTLLTFFVSFLAVGQGNVADDTQFQKEIQSLIKVYFEAFNTCKVDKTVELLSNDFEFYHDQAGPVTGKDNMRKIIEDVCKRNNYDWIQARLMGEQKIFPLKANGKLYGAIVTGELFFYMVDKQSKREIKESTSSFTWVLRIEEGNWRITRDLSYNHQD